MFIEIIQIGLNILAIYNFGNFKTYLMGSAKDMLWIINFKEKIQQTYF